MIERVLFLSVLACTHGTSVEPEPLALVVSLTVTMDCATCTSTVAHARVRGMGRYVSDHESRKPGDVC